VRRAECPRADLSIKITEALLGDALVQTDVKLTVAALCTAGSPVCDINMSKVTPDLAGKILRVSWTCECGVGEWQTGEEFTLVTRQHRSFVSG
jgi:hypothetical protein